MLISLVICTYNRSEILRATLPSVLGLKIPDGASLELIIVDNNSNDTTAEFAKEFIRDNKDNLNAHYVFEKKQGLSYARNTGAENSNGEYVAYIDDECILPEQWLVVACKSIDLKRPSFLGGPYYGKYLPGSSSSWYRESFGDSYILQYNLSEGPLINRYLSGGNLFVRKDVFSKSGLFDVELGMSGETLSYGEEVELQKRFLEDNSTEEIWYDPELFVWHCIRDDKMKISFLFKDALVRGASSAELVGNRDDLRRGPINLLTTIGKAFVSLLKKLISSFVSDEHFFFLLYEDYKNGTWRDIGGAWYRTKALFK